MDRVIIYLHGFLSSPQSQKARQTLDYVQLHHPEIAYELLANYLGEHTNPYTQETFLLQACHTEQLRQLRRETIRQGANYWVLLQTADETLDYRLAAEKYVHSKLTIEAGGDHSFQGFERFIPDIVSFLLRDS